MSVAFDHRIEDHHQLANAGGQRGLMWFADPAQPQIEVAQRAATQDRIVRRHVQSAAQVGPPAKEVALTPPFPALASKGRHPDQGGDRAR